MARHTRLDMAASYTPLKTIAEDVEHCSCLEDRSRQPLEKLRRLSVASVALLVLQVVLLFAHLTATWTGRQESFIQATYGFDTNYMSIDSSYDWVWEERAIERAGTVVVSRDDNGDVTEYGTISM